MDIVVLIMGITGVALIAFLASVAVARLSRSYQIVRTSLGEFAQGEGIEGTLYDLSVEVKVLHFDGLDNPSTLILTEGEVRIQATDPDRLVAGARGISLLPEGAGTLSGRPENLGFFRILATYEELPIPHLRIRGAKGLETQPRGA